MLGAFAKPSFKHFVGLLLCQPFFESKDSIFHLDMGEFEPDTPKVVLCTQRC